MPNEKYIKKSSREKIWAKKLKINNSFRIRMQIILTQSMTYLHIAKPPNTIVVNAVILEYIMGI